MSVCLPSAQGPSLAATAERPLSFGRRPESVTAADWTSCLLLFLPSYLLRRTICLPLCERAVIGRLVVQHLTPKLISTHAAVSGRQFFCVCVCVCMCVFDTNATLLDCGSTEDTCALCLFFCFFCGTVDRRKSGRKTVKVRGCSVWDEAGQTQLGKQ